MELTAEQVARVAALARIRVDEDELPGIGKELSGIFHWIDQLESVDVTNVEIYSDTKLYKHLSFQTLRAFQNQEGKAAQCH